MKNLTNVLVLTLTAALTAVASNCVLAAEWAP